MLQALCRLCSVEKDVKIKLFLFVLAVIRPQLSSLPEGGAVRAQTETPAHRPDSARCTCVMCSV